MGARVGYRLGLAWFAALLLFSFAAAPLPAASIDDLLRADVDAIEAITSKGDIKGAIEPTRRLVAKARKLLRKDDPRIVIYAAGLADLYEKAGDGKKALAIAKAANKLVVAGIKDSPDLVKGLTTLARLLANARLYAQAEALLSRAIAIAEDTGGPSSVDAVQLKSQLVSVYEQDGRLAEAEQLRQSLRATAPRQADEGGSAARDRKLTNAESDAKSAEESAPSAGAPAPSPAPAPEKPADQPKPKKKTNRSAAEKAAPPAAATAPKAAEPAAQFSVVPVFYGTNRAPSTGAARVSYSSTESPELGLGVAMVTVPNTHVVPQLERPWELRVPGTEIVLSFEAQDPTKHFTLKSIEALSEDQFTARARERVAGAKTYQGQALVFVHGFYNTFDDALYRTAQIAYDLQFDGGAFMYSWPSAGTLDAYRTDRPKAKNAGAKLRQFLTLVATKTGATRVSVIAHSMGNLPLMEALDETVPLGGPSPSAAIDEVVLAAPDIGRKEFTVLADHMKKVRGGITLYAASNDVALEASRTFFNNEPRAGDTGSGGPLLLPHVDTIDATRASTQFFRLNHYYVAESSPILCDVEHLLRGGVRPPSERSKILASVKSATGTYYAYRP